MGPIGPLGPLRGISKNAGYTRKQYNTTYRIREFKRRLNKNPSVGKAQPLKSANGGGGLPPVIGFEKTQPQTTGGNMVEKLYLRHRQ